MLTWTWKKADGLAKERLKKLAIDKEQSNGRERRSLWFSKSWMVCGLKSQRNSVHSEEFAKSPNTKRLELEMVLIDGLPEEERESSRYSTTESGVTPKEAARGIGKLNTTSEERESQPGRRRSHLSLWEGWELRSSWLRASRSSRYWSMEKDGWTSELTWYQWELSEEETSSSSKYWTASTGSPGVAGNQEIEHLTRSQLLNPRRESRELRKQGNRKRWESLKRKLLYQNQWPSQWRMVKDLQSIPNLLELVARWFQWMQRSGSWLSKQTRETENLTGPMTQEPSKLETGTTEDWQCKVVP